MILKPRLTRETGLDRPENRIMGRDHGHRGEMAALSLHIIIFGTCPDCFLVTALRADSR